MIQDFVNLFFMATIVIVFGIIIIFMLYVVIDYSIENMKEYEDECIEGEVMKNGRYVYVECD